MLVKDVIYDLIEVPELCVKFMNTREFQRLKRIKQLGNVPEVYPSGVHTRAEHSLGVMHISGVFYDTLLKNSKPNVEYKNYKLLIQLAGLLHDIGHGPKSHLFEEAMKIRNIAFCHEEHSIYLINKINNRLHLISEEEVEIIESMILGKKMLGYPPYLFEIISNKDSGLDTDKMDYLVRDAYNTGKPKISVESIIQHCQIDECGHISYSKEVKQDIRNLFECRKHMYEEVYFHKTVAKIDKFWICAMCQLPIDTTDPDCFLNLDDSSLDFLVRHFLKHDLIRCLDERDLTHNCEACPDVVLKRVAKLSGDTDGDPLLKIRWF